MLPPPRLITKQSHFRVVWFICSGFSQTSVVQACVCLCSGTPIRDELQSTEASSLTKQLKNVIYQLFHVISRASRGLYQSVEKQYEMPKETQEKAIVGQIAELWFFPTTRSTNKNKLSEYTSICISLTTWLPSWSTYCLQLYEGEAPLRKVHQLTGLNIAIYISI